MAAHDTVRLLGIPEAAFCCAMANPDGAARLNALSNTVLCGGGSRVPGLQQRCLRELRGVLPSTLQISMLKCAFPALFCSPLGACLWHACIEHDLHHPLSCATYRA